MVENKTNADREVIDGFGDEWTRFDQHKLPTEERERLSDLYFGIFPWDKLPASAVGFDLGCGSGRWAKSVAPRVGKLICIDASADALSVARGNLKDQKNCEFVHAEVDHMPLANDSMDFGYSLGVLHHVPDTLAGIKSCVTKFKRGAPFLLYLYWAFDDKPLSYRLIWRISDQFRKVISRLPMPLRYLASQIMAVTAYYPLARLSSLAERLGYRGVDSIPLSFYRNCSFYTMRTDALDRFGTQLEQRFTRDEIHSLMTRSGLTDIQLSDERPCWVAVGYKL